MINSMLLFAVSFVLGFMACASLYLPALKRAEASAVWSTRFPLRDGSEVEVYKLTNGKMTCAYTVFDDTMTASGTRQWFGILKDTTPR